MGWQNQTSKVVVNTEDDLMGSYLGRVPRLAVLLSVAAVLLLIWLLREIPPRFNQESAEEGAQQTRENLEAANGRLENQPAQKLGLLINDRKAFPGYTLLATMTSSRTYLIDMQGRVVRTWKSNCTPASGAYLLENGNLLRPGALGQEMWSFGGGPGGGGRVQEFTWDGELVWDFRLHNDRQLPHDDFAKLPNGNVLLIVWDKRTSSEAIVAGRAPALAGSQHFLADSLIEVKPTGKSSGEVVWQWHVWDHLIQDKDRSKANYGNVAEHPELIDINYGAGPSRVNPDWTHFNSVAYNAEFDQIVVSILGFSEFWVMDHSTTTAEAGSHRGGRAGKGGDLLYRWGNPRAYRAGTKADQRLFAQHDAHWIPRGRAGRGHILVFNNGGDRPEGSYSSVDEIVLPVDGKGSYARGPEAAYGPDKPAWSYTAPRKSDFFSPLNSGAQRLPNGNTLICSGGNGTVFEVTPDKEVVWKYVNPTTVQPDDLRQLGRPRHMLVFGPGTPDSVMAFGQAGASSLSRAYRYAADYAGLAGKDLRPGKTIEELQQNQAKGK